MSGKSGHFRAGVKRKKTIRVIIWRRAIMTHVSDMGPAAPPPGPISTRTRAHPYPGQTVSGNNHSQVVSYPVLASSTEACPPGSRPPSSYPEVDEKMFYKPSNYPNLYA